jgi:DNA-binding transcriptional MerR regulator
MLDSLPIDEVVRRTGLTSRALRFYEARGLLKPLRTQSGRRWFGPDDLERIHHIVTLKKAGFSLADIRRILSRNPVSLSAILTSQRDRLAEQRQEIAQAVALLDTALSRIDRGEPLDAATLCSLIHDGEHTMTNHEQAWRRVIDRYFTAEQQRDWETRMPAASELTQDDYQQRWRALGDRIDSALPLYPASDAALELVRDWFSLLEPFSRVATPDMWERTRAMYDGMESWPTGADAGFDKRVWDFINEATDAARKASQDIGPVPPFMRQ